MKDLVLFGKGTVTCQMLRVSVSKEQDQCKALFFFAEYTSAAADRTDHNYHSHQDKTIV